MRDLVYPLPYRPHGEPFVCAFSIQLNAAGAEWLRREARRHGWNVDQQALDAAPNGGGLYGGK